MMMSDTKIYPGIFPGNKKPFNSIEDWKKNLSQSFPGTSSAEFLLALPQAYMGKSNNIYRILTSASYNVR